MKINSISGSHPDFPERLRNIPGAPKRLHTTGILPDYSLGVAIVGTRKPTSYGRTITTQLAEKLARRGALIISGLAHGIDAIAHRGALEVGGKTIAVLPAGLDTIYPAAHRALAASITKNGALVSEYDPGTPPLPYRFLERNRIVSGLADIVIVTEASARSGTMNTVSHALEQGREVYAVPGPITSSTSTGCNALIAQGATPIVNIDEFVERILPAKSSPQTHLFAENDTELAILKLIQQGVNDGEVLQAQSGLDPALYSQTMTLLEIRGAVRALGANRWSL